MWYSVMIIIIAAVLGLVWSYYHYTKLQLIPVTNNQSNLSDEIQLEQERSSTAMGPVEIGSIIHQGATQFIVSQYKICLFFVLLMAVIVFFCVDQAKGVLTTFAFLVGAVTSMFCGAIGMKIATYSNYRTTIMAKRSLGAAFNTAYRAGCVMGFVLVSVSMLILLVLILLYKQILGLKSTSMEKQYFQHLFESVAGYGLGGSTVALFARVGGGIFTKAADLGSDLVGKIQAGLPEDSPMNPATIADNVGDNVGDVAGMGADLFGSFAQSACAALVIMGNSVPDKNLVYEFGNFFFILAIPAVGILVCIMVTSFLTEGQDIAHPHEVESSLKKQLIYSTVILVPIFFCISKWLIGPFEIFLSETQHHTKFPYQTTLCLSGGLIAGLVIGYFTEIMTSYSYKPVRQLSESCKTGAATNVIYGLALGYLSTIVPVAVLCVVCYCSHYTMGYFGVALSALGMLSNLPICLAIDGYGPISDNAGGIAQMAELPYEVRQRTDVLDAAGNTTAAIGKGFAIGSATLVGFALYGAFLHRVYSFKKITPGSMSFDDPMIFTSLLFGAMIPYAFSALTMKSVGQAALGMIDEVRRQIRVNPGILNGTSSPDYKSCVRISTQSSLKEMILPGLLVTVTPFLLGFAFGPKALLGFLPGAIVSGVQMAISASNTGGAWDNAKKFIEAGLMKDSEGNIVKKGSQIHKAAVIGDTIGDPLKDTSGPSLNILIKLMAILSLVFCKYFSK